MEGYRWTWEGTRLWEEEGTVKESEYKYLNCDYVEHQWQLKLLAVYVTSANSLYTMKIVVSISVQKNDE